MTTENKNAQATTSWVADIAKLHEKFGVNTTVDKMSREHRLKFLKYRLDFILEELTEAYESLGYVLLSKPCMVTPPEQLTLEHADGVVDALIDVSVLAVGGLDFLKIDSDLAWERVQAANMAKEPGINPKRPNELGLPDMLKPEGWQSPTHMDNLGILPEMFGPLNG